MRKKHFLACTCTKLTPAISQALWEDIDYICVTNGWWKSKHGQTESHGKLTAQANLDAMLARTVYAAFSDGRLFYSEDVFLERAQWTTPPLMNMYVRPMTDLGARLPKVLEVHNLKPEEH
jgi:hypothetical protein